MVRDGRVRVATDERGRKALTGAAGAEPLVLGSGDAEAVWRRHGMTSGKLVRALGAMPSLCWVHTDTAGVDDLPLAELAARGVTVTKTSAYTEAVAEWIATAVLLAAKGVPAYVRASDARRWLPEAGSPRLVAGSAALLVGNGAIGSYAGAMLRGMGVRVHTASRGSAPWRPCLGNTDWLILACPLTSETRHLIGAAALAELKPGAWVVNVARGGVLDQRALADALDAGGPGGAVLDAFDTEPLPPGSPLWGRPNVVVLPHDAWRAEGAGRRQTADFADQLRRYREGRPLRRAVDACAGY